eukprot:COSAG02_NODE_4864_length_4888_cov_3.269576_2_plen_206_part_00
MLTCLLDLVRWFRSPGALDKLTSLSRTNIPAAEQDLDADELGGLEGLEELEELAGELYELAEEGQQQQQQQQQHHHHHQQLQQCSISKREEELVEKERALIKAIRENEETIARLEQLGTLSDADTHVQLKQLKDAVEKQAEEMIVIKETLVFGKDKKKENKRKIKEVSCRDRMAPRVLLRPCLADQPAVPASWFAGEATCEKQQE